MQDTSQIANFDIILATGDYEVKSRVVINGVAYGEDKLFDLYTTPTLFSDSPSVGNCYSAEIDFSMIMPSELIPTMAEIKPYVRLRSFQETQFLVDHGRLVLPNGMGQVTDKTLALNGNAYVTGTTLVLNSTASYVYSDWLQKGVFYIDTREIAYNDLLEPVLTIHGYDAMLKTEAIYPVDDAVYPQSDVYVVELIAETIGVEVDDRTYGIMTNNYQINLPATYTMREVLSYIGSMYAGNWCISPEGKLRLVGLTDIGTETNYLIDESGDAIVFGEDRILV